MADVLADGRATLAEVILADRDRGHRRRAGAHRSREHRGRAVHGARPRVRSCARRCATSIDAVRLRPHRLPAEPRPADRQRPRRGDGVIIPVQTQYYAMKGLNNLVKVINAIRLKLNKDLKVLGLLPTFYDGRTNLAKDMLDELRVVGDHHVFNTHHPQHREARRGAARRPADHVVRQLRPTRLARTASSRGR